jgi:uncharacterized protein YqhQ
MKMFFVCLGLVVLMTLLVPEGGGAFVATVVQRVCIAAVVIGIGYELFKSKE